MKRTVGSGTTASFNRWKELGRRVKKGEKALTLCMPIQIKCREWDEKCQESGGNRDCRQRLERGSDRCHGGDGPL
jgi:hypothetical protein